MLDRAALERVAEGFGITLGVIGIERPDREAGVLDALVHLPGEMTATEDPLAERLEAALPACHTRVG